MDILTPITRRLVTPLWARWERSPYLTYYHRLLRRQFDSPSTVRTRQEEAVREIVRHAYDTTPFWRERMDQTGMHPSDVGTLDDLRAIPPLTKEELRREHDRLRSTVDQKFPLHQRKTSGSTGVSVQVDVDEAAQQWKRACTLRSDEWSGWKLGERVAKVWGHPEYLERGLRGRLRNSLLERARYLDTLKMDEPAMRRFLIALRRHPPSLLFGHAHSLYLFAQFARASGGAGFAPRGIISTAMVLLDSQRRVIEDVFQQPVTNRYGSEEVSLIACECERHHGLHINADGVYVEILRPKDGSPVDSGEPGMVVVTDLVNKAMPILRYQIGDMAVWADRHCPCGRGFPMLEKIEGRTADYVVTPSGEFISGISLTENFALLAPEIAQLQIVQETMDHLLLRIVKAPNFDSHSRRRIGALIEERFGPGVSWDCEFVDRIPQEPSGKYRFCISKVEQPLAGATL